MNLRTPYRAALCAAVCLLASANIAHAATIVVPAGGNLQAALNAAQAGDVITLAPGATYVGNFFLPNKGAITQYITLRSAAPDSALPPAGTRMTAAFSAMLPKLRSSTNMPALRTAPAANHWKLLFIEFQANLNGYGDVIALGAGDASQTQLAQVPYALVLDRLYVHGDPVVGQKRGIALHSRDTTIINSSVTECKAIGQDSQAIGGFNGPGNYLIENNYLEGATENFLLGGADPAIPGLITTNVTFRRNHLRKPLAWRDPIIAMPAAPAARAVVGGGALAAGTYSYRVAARVAAGQENKANSSATVAVSATVAAGTTAGVNISWTPVVGAEDYVVYGRTGAQNMYWKTTTPYFTDTGAAGTAGTPVIASKWAVKNIFELKNAQDVIIEGNVFENIWVADQTGYAIIFTPRNQGGQAPWATVRRVTFQYNLVRHAAGGVNILGIDNLAPTQRANSIVVRHNVFDDLTSATWGSGSRPFILGDGPDTVTIDHNTIVSTNPALVWLYGGSVTSPAQATDAVITNNMAAHNAYGIMASNVAYGSATIAAYLPGSVVTRNVLAGGSASRYPTGNFVPTAAAWQSSFVNFAAGDYHLVASSPYKNIGTDGADLGADIGAVNAQTASALSGDNSVPAGTSPIRITTTLLPAGVMNQSYAQTLTCTGGSGPCAWQIGGSSLPAGLAFDAVAALLSGTPSQVQTGLLVVEAFDPGLPTNRATATLSITIDPPPFVVTMPTALPAHAGTPFGLTPGVSGAMGSPTWSLATGSFPSGVTMDPASGAIHGVPESWGTFTAMVQAQDSWGTNRIDAKPVVVTVAPAPLAIAPVTLSPASVMRSYQATLSASGGTGQTRWTLSAGSLPAGLSMAANGAITGTPTTVGVAAFTVQASDDGWPGNIATAALTLNVGAREIVLYASDATRVAGAWSLVSDATAAGGSRLVNPDVAAAKLGAALASPVNYFEMTFQAQAGVAYHLWMRGKADKNSWANDSAHVQFSGTVTSAGAPIYRIGTTSSTALSIEDGTNAGLAGWGWADDSYGGFASPLFFATSGPQTIRVQVREDGLSLDQIVLSAGTYFTTAPGATKNDTTRLAR